MTEANETVKKTQDEGALKKEEEKSKRRQYRREKRIAKAKRRGRILTVRFLLLALIIGLAVFAYLYVDGKLDGWFPHNDREGLRPNGILGYTAIDFQEAILGETRTMTEVVVLEQDVSVDTTITNALANLSIFQKTKVIHSFGTGVYTVDLSALTEDAVTISRIQQTVTVTIPAATLKYVNIDTAATTFEETEHALLAFGDIKLTQEQQQELNVSIEAAMREKLENQENINAANEAAKTTVAQLLAPYVSSVSEDYTVVVHVK
jgi:hypothetical protein